jgi:hypothetical protein
VLARRQRLTVDDFRRLAKACRDLDDPVVMAKATRMTPVTRVCGRRDARDGTGDEASTKVWPTS